MLRFRFIPKSDVVNNDTLISWGESLEEAKNDLIKINLNPDKYFGGSENYTVEVSEMKTKPEAI